MIQEQWDKALCRLHPITYPEAYNAFWCKQKEKATPFTLQKKAILPIKNQYAVYETLQFCTSNTECLHAHFVYPKQIQKPPLVMLFHDKKQPLRGWFHMTRYVAAGYAIFALENGCDVEDTMKLYADAITAVNVIQTLPGIDHSKLVSWGEGIGASLALGVAGLFPQLFCGCGVQNPLSTTESTYFATQMQCPFLMGTSGLDDIVPPEKQLAIWHAVQSEKKHFLYAKYTHERINAFENEWLMFLQQLNGWKMV